MNTGGPAWLKIHHILEQKMAVVGAQEDITEMRRHLKQAIKKLSVEKIQEQRLSTFKFKFVY